MTMSDVIGLIFQEWNASLKSRDRSKAAVPSNFEELFEKLKNSGVAFDDAHALLPRAIKAHQPIPAVARNSYKKIKSLAIRFDKSEKEFTDEWNKSIEDVGTQVFF